MLISISAEDLVKNPSVFKQYFDATLPKVLSFCIQVLIALLVLWIGSKIIKWILKLVKKTFTFHEIDPGVAGFLTQIVKYALYVVLVMIILAEFGVTTGSVVALLGSAGLTIGLGLQGSLANFAGGVLILLLKPFVLGDYIIEKSTGLEGTVTGITICYTKLTTFDNKEISVPNGNLSNTTIVNVTKNAKRRVDIKVSVAYETDLKKAQQVLLEIAQNDERVLKDEPIVAVVSELADSGVEMQLRVWAKTEEYWDVFFDLNQNVKTGLEKHGITIPFPQLDVKIKQ